MSADTLLYSKILNIILDKKKKSLKRFFSLLYLNVFRWYVINAQNRQHVEKTVRIAGYCQSFLKQSNIRK